jgi:ABC-type Zn2+ transport system substrate-binding protein/surface adhesin
VTVSAGQSFDPKTGKVVPTTPAFEKNIIADIKTVKDISDTFKTGGATIVVDSENNECSPIHGGGGDHDHDHDHNHDHDHDHDHDDGHHHDGDDHHDDHGGSGDGYAGGDSGHGK